MIGIDMRIFDLNKLYYHIGSGSQALVENRFHDISNLILKPLESVDIVQVNTTDDIS